MTPACLYNRDNRYDLHLCCAKADIALVDQQVRRRLRSLVMDVDNDIGDYRAEKMVNNITASPRGLESQSKHFLPAMS